MNTKNWITVEATVTLSGEVLSSGGTKIQIRVGLSENGLFFVLILSFLLPTSFFSFTS